MQRNQKVTHDIVHYKDVDEKLLASVKPDAIIITGQTTPWASYDVHDFNGLRKSLKSFEQPVLGICGGHQLLALLNGGKVALIKGKLSGDTYAGCFREEGLIKTRIVKEDLLLRGLSHKAMVYVSHCEEIKKVPDHFEVLLKGKKSKYQMIKHRTKSIYGVQFHPEWSTDDKSDGMIIFDNFMKKVLADHE